MQSYFRSSLLSTSKDDRKYVCFCESLLTVITDSLHLNPFSLFRRKCKTCRRVPRLLSQHRRHHCLASVPFFARPKPKIPFLFLCSETTRKRLTIALVMATRSTYLGTGSTYSTKQHIRFHTVSCFEMVCSSAPPSGTADQKRLQTIPKNPRAICRSGFNVSFLQAFDYFVQGTDQGPDFINLDVGSKRSLLC